MNGGGRCIPRVWLSSRFKRHIYSAVSFGFFLLIAPSSFRVPLTACARRAYTGPAALAIHHRTKRLFEFGSIVCAAPACRGRGRVRPPHQNAIYHQLRYLADILQHNLTFVGITSFCPYRTGNGWYETSEIFSSLASILLTPGRFLLYHEGGEGMRRARGERRGAAKILIIPVVFADDKWRRGGGRMRGVGVRVRPRQKLMIPAAPPRDPPTRRCGFPRFRSDEEGSKSREGGRAGPGLDCWTGRLM